MSVIALRTGRSPAQGREQPVESSVDDSIRRIFVKINGQATGRHVSTGVCSIFLTRPDAVTYDMLYDLRDYAGDVTAEDVMPIVAVYAECKPDTSVPCRTAFVTSDPNFDFWAAAMNEQFPGRTHKSFKVLEHAEAWLKQPLAER